LAYDFGDHPLNPIRLDFTMRLARDLGGLESVDLIAPVSASGPSIS
jgi:acetoin utilization protein AcuC